MAESAHKTPLREHVEEGERLVASAALVGDSDDFVVWLQRCMEWRCAVDDFLAGEHGAGALHEVKVAADAIRLEGDWQERLAAEIARVDVTNDLLSRLASDHDGSGPA